MAVKGGGGGMWEGRGRGGGRGGGGRRGGGSWESEAKGWGGVEREAGVDGRVEGGRGRETERGGKGEKGGAWGSTNMGITCAQEKRRKKEGHAKRTGISRLGKKEDLPVGSFLFICTERKKKAWARGASLGRKESRRKGPAKEPTFADRIRKKGLDICSVCGEDSLVVVFWGGLGVLLGGPELQKRRKYSKVFS